MDDKQNQLMVIEQEKQIMEAQKAKLCILRDGGMLPKGCNEKEAWARMAVGVEMGMRPMQALNGIAIVNGHPTLHTDSIPSIIMASGLLEDQGVEWIGEGDKLACRYWCKKKGLATPQDWVFSIEDAKRAGLLNRDTWRNHTRKMLYNRARTYCLRNTFPEVLGNMYDMDEASEFKEQPVEAAPLVEPTPAKRTRKPKEEIVVEPVEIKAEAPKNEPEEIIDVEVEEPVDPRVAALDEEEPMPTLVQPREESPAQQAPFNLFEE